jgi:exocyst complex component 4
MGAEYIMLIKSVPVIAPDDNTLPRPDTAEPIRSPTMSPDPNNAVAGPGPSSRFSRYLSSLAVRPAPDPMIDHMDAGLSSLPSQGSIAQVLPNSQDSANGSTYAGEPHNPEADSYGYIEAVLGALFVLGKLTGALETVAQRVSTEIHHLIETTLDEVEERSALESNTIDKLADDSDPSRRERKKPLVDRTMFLYPQP